MFKTSYVRAISWAGAASQPTNSDHCSTTLQFISHVTFFIDKVLPPAFGGRQWLLWEEPRLY